MNAIKRFFKLIMDLEIIIGVFSIITIVLIIVAEIIMRSIFRSSILWVQEYIIMAFIWAVAFGAAYAFKVQSHIVITTFVKFLPEKMEKLMRIIISLGIMVVLIYLIMNLPATIRIQNRTTTASMPIRIPRGYYYSLPLLICVWTMTFAQLYYLFFQFRALFGLANPDNFKLKSSFCT